MKESDALVEIGGVTICRDGLAVLEDVSWRMGRGEHWFIMGNNGAGKTSLLETIMAYVWPRKGSVTVLGEKYGRTFIPDVRKRIGYVSPWIFERMHSALPVRDVVISGRDASVGFWGEISDADLNRIMGALELFDAGNLLDRIFGNLSSGERFRVIMARAMVNRPELLILDEPFAQLDMGTRLHLYARMERIVREGNTGILLVTHHLEDIRPVFTHGLFLKDGRVFASGERQNVLEADVLSGLFDISEKRLIHGMMSGHNII